jgi:hypothetical protein
MDSLASVRRLSLFFAVAAAHARLHANIVTSPPKHSSVTVTVDCAAVAAMTARYEWCKRVPACASRLEPFRSSARSMLLRDRMAHTQKGWPG